jgi:Domain of unknown function (DUF4326)
MPDRIQLSRARGWRKPPGAVVVSRPSKWGNPFAIGERIDRNSPLWPYIAQVVPGGAADLNDIVPLAPEMVVTAYGWWFIQQPALMLTVREELGGKDLACWCKIGRPCHGDWLLDFLRELED